MAVYHAATLASSVTVATSVPMTSTVASFHPQRHAGRVSAESSPVAVHERGVGFGAPSVNRDNGW